MKGKDYYLESKRLRKEALEIAETYKGNPKRFSISNGIEMDIEITKSDIKTIVSKNTQDNLFNAVKNAFLFPKYGGEIENKGYVELEILHDLGLENIQVIMLPANQLNQYYLDNQKIDISSLELLSF